MRLPNAAHTSRPWRIHEIAPDFRLEDVWKLPTPGGRDDLARLVRLAIGLSDGYEYPAVFRALFTLRWKLGTLFGWDEADAGVGERVSSLRERLPPISLKRRVAPICAPFRAEKRRTGLRFSARSTRRTTSGQRSSPTRPCTR